MCKHLAGSGFGESGCRRDGKRFSKVFALILLCFNIACAGSYAKKIKATEEAFFNGDVDAAVASITPLAQDSSSRDRLLFYMEAGVVFHTKGDYQTSNDIFRRADEMAEEIKASITDSTKAFLLSDREGAFQGENFERVLIKYYLALNQVMLGDLENAKRTLRKLEADLKDMKYEDSAYKQILAARYLDALVSEELRAYNDARVQYKNLEIFGVDNAWLGGERYVLAERAGDAGDRAKYAAYRRQPLSIKPAQPGEKGNGELVLLVQSGKAAVKSSRGNLMNDREFALALRVAIDVAIITHGKGLSTAGVIAMMGTAENPIAKFTPREADAAPVLALDETSLPGVHQLTDFDAIAEKNFNENYSSYINKNVASIATKIVIAAVAADALAQQLRKKDNGIVGALGGLAVGLGAGAGVAATVKPDLRSWHMLPARFSAVRVALPAGSYRLKLAAEDPNRVVFGLDAQTVEIKPGKKTFVSMRTFRRGL